MIYEISISIWIFISLCNIHNSIINLLYDGNWKRALKIDEIVPCLKDNKTGEIIETEVIRIRRAADSKLVEHYCETFGAEHLGLLHPYQFFIDEEHAAKIKEVYDYEWTDEEL